MTTLDALSAIYGTAWTGRQILEFKLRPYRNQPMTAGDTRPLQSVPVIGGHVNQDLLVPTAQNAVHDDELVASVDELFADSYVEVALETARLADIANADTIRRADDG